MLMRFFQEVSKKYPPPEQKRHNITFDVKSDSLILTLWIDGNQMRFTIDESELNDVEKLLLEIEKNIKTN
jgi:hypothetical protein